MGRKITKERIKELERQDHERKRLQKEGKTLVSHKKKIKKKKKQEKEKKWAEGLKKRGGFIPKRARHWGDPCSHNECEKWEDGECAHQDRDVNGCYMDEKKEGGTDAD